VRLRCASAGGARDPRWQFQSPHGGRNSAGRALGCEPRVGLLAGYPPNPAAAIFSATISIGLRTDRARAARSTRPNNSVEHAIGELDAGDCACRSSHDEINPADAAHRPYADRDIAEAIASLADARTKAIGALVICHLPGHSGWTNQRGRPTLSSRSNSSASSCAFRSRESSVTRISSGQGGGAELDPWHCRFLLRSSLGAHPSVD
jgi:hypothetical protein